MASSRRRVAAMDPATARGPLTQPASRASRADAYATTPGASERRTTPLRVLVTDEIDPDGVALLKAERELEVHELPTLPAAELLERVAEYDAIVGRSATKISPELLRRATRLRVVGRAGVGVDN